MTMERPKPGGRLQLARWTLFYSVTALGTVANGIQVLTTGRPTAAGLLTAGLIGVVSLLPAVYQLGRERGAANPDEGAAGRSELAMRTDELGTIKTVLDSTLGAYRPFREWCTIVFVIGEVRDDDQIEEIRQTTHSHSSVVLWSQFEALGVGQSQILNWDNIDLHIERAWEDDGDPQRAKMIQIRDRPVPRALILFAPPREQVKWTANYRSPGYWDRLRTANGQRFSWSPPLVRPEENGGQRTPVQKVTFVFQVPASLGELQIPAPPADIAYQFKDDPQSGIRTHRFTIDDLNAYLATHPTANNAIAIFLLLDRRDAG